MQKAHIFANPTGANSSKSLGTPTAALQRIYMQPHEVIKRQIQQNLPHAEVASGFELVWGIDPLIFVEGKWINRKNHPTAKPNLSNSKVRKGVPKIWKLSADLNDVHGPDVGSFLDETSAHRDSSSVVFSVRTSREFVRCWSPSFSREKQTEMSGRRFISTVLLCPNQPCDILA